MIFYLLINIMIKRNICLFRKGNIDYLMGIIVIKWGFLNIRRKRYLGYYI